jgi:hypothetical protein
MVSILIIVAAFVTLISIVSFRISWVMYKEVNSLGLIIRQLCHCSLYELKRQAKNADTIHRYNGIASTYNKILAKEDQIELMFDF